MRLVCTQGSVVVVNSGRELVVAVANPDVDTVVMQRDIVLGPSDWDGFPSPIPILRNLTVLGDGSAVPGVRPVLDAGFQRARVRLGHMVTFEFRGVGLINIATSNFNLATNFVLFAACLSGEVSVVSIQECFGVLELCYPAEMQAQVAELTPRPPWLPGPQSYKLHLPQDGCVNVTAGGAAAVPLERRCWPQLGLFVDIAVPATDVDVNQKQVSLGYFGHIANSTYACKEQLPYDCVETLGTVGCVTAWLAGALSPPPPTAAPAPAPPPANSGEGSSGRSSDQGTHSTSNRVSGGGSRGGASLGAILGGVLGGLLLVTCAVTAVALLVIRRRRRQPRALYASSGSDEAGKAGACCQAAVKTEGSGHGAVTAQQSGKARGFGTPACYDGSGGGATASTGLGSRSPGEGTPTVTCVVAPSEGERQPPMRASRLGFGRADPQIPVTPFTPPRPDVALNARPGREVTLLPTVLGKGAFGRVVEGVYQGRKVAVKVLLDTALEEWGLAKHLRVAGAVGCSPADGSDAKDAAARGPEDGEGEGGGHVGDETNCALVGSLVQEVEVLGRCRHPNVVTLLAACLEPPRFCLVLERMETSLDKMLYGNGPGHLLPMQEVLSIAIDVARGLEYLHPTVLHRDLKPANVLVNSPGSARMVAKLSDFGLSRLRHTVVPTANPEVGTTEYMAPELFALYNDVVTDRADVYSFGVLLWAMLSGQRPWEDVNMVVIAVRVTLKRERPPLRALPRGRSTPKLHRIISQCWEGDPKRRPAAAELVKELLLVREQLLSEPDHIQRPELPGPSSDAYDGRCTTSSEGEGSGSGVSGGRDCGGGKSRCEYQ